MIQLKPTESCELILSGEELHVCVAAFTDIPYGAAWELRTALIEMLCSGTSGVNISQGDLRRELTQLHGREVILELDAKQRRALITSLRRFSDSINAAAAAGVPWKRYRTHVPISARHDDLIRAAETATEIGKRLRKLRARHEPVNWPERRAPAWELDEILQTAGVSGEPGS